MVVDCVSDILRCSIVCRKLVSCLEGNIRNPIISIKYKIRKFTDFLGISQHIQSKRTLGKQMAERKKKQA